MCLLLESICVVRRQLALASWHNRRMNRSRFELFGAAERWNVEELIAIPPGLTDAVYKCRVLYDTDVRSVEFLPYVPRRVRSLRLVQAPPELDYAHKYANRAALGLLYSQRRTCDDVLIVQGTRITDTSFSSIAFYDGEQWYTPARPLLRGVRVDSLIEQGVLHTADIHTHDLPSFQKAVLLNAMLGFEENVEVDIAAVEAA